MPRITRTASVLVAALGIAALSGCTIGTIDLNGTVRTESRDASGFTEVRLEGQGDVFVTVGPEASVEITADTALLDVLRTHVDDGVLVLDSLPSGTTGSYDIRYDITVPSLESLALTGAGNISISGALTDLEAITLSGAGDISVTGVDSAGVAVSLSGAGDISIAGTATTVVLTLSGAGNIDARGLASADATASVSGAGNLTVTATGSLDASLSGVGEITYFGGPALTRSVSGVGAITAGD